MERGDQSKEDDYNWRVSKPYDWDDRQISSRSEQAREGRCSVIQPSFDCLSIRDTLDYSLCCWEFVKLTFELALR